MAKREDVVPAHVGLGRHPKTLKLAAVLGVSVPQAVGHLMFLWWWALEYAPDGDLSSFGPESLASACAWKGEPPDLMLALEATGFLDEAEGGGFVIHDWSDHAGAVFARRRVHARRQKRRRKDERQVEPKAEPEEESTTREGEFRDR